MITADEARCITNVARNDVYSRIKYACEHGENRVSVLIYYLKDESEDNYKKRVFNIEIDLYANGFDVNTRFLWGNIFQTYKIAELDISW